MRELEFLGTYPQVPKMQISARFVNNWHYSMKQLDTLIGTMNFKVPFISLLHDAILVFF